MVRGPKKHLKRLNAPRHWLLGKMEGKYAPKPSPGPHKEQECLPLIVFIRNRLKYALNRQEVTKIMMQRLIKVDSRVRTDPTYPAGFMDVISIAKTNENFRLLFDVKGRYAVHRITAEEASYKLCKVKKNELGPRGIPYVVTHDGRTIRFPNPDIKVNDSIRLDVNTGAVSDIYKFDVGQLVMCIGGANRGRVGTVIHTEHHPGSTEIVHVKDSKGSQFATRLGNIFVIGNGKSAAVSLPKGEGVKKSILEK